MSMLIFFILVGYIQAGFGLELTGRDSIQRLSIIEGDTLALSCNARPNLLRSYRWVYIREGTRKPKVLTLGRRLVVDEPRMSIESETVDGRVNLILKLKEIRSHESGLFMCWRQKLQPEPRVFVKVFKHGTAKEEPPTINISESKKVVFGSSVELSCRIQPSWPGKVTWRKNGVSIDPQSQVELQYVEEGIKGELVAYLNISSVRRETEYTCYVPSMPPVSASTVIQVRVPKIESLEFDPPLHIVNYGERLLVTCLASGTDSDIVWLRDGINLVDNIGPGLSLQSFSTSPNDTKKSTLMVDPFSSENSGLYACYVPGDSKGMLLSIEDRAPRIVEVTGWDFRSGQVLRLTCSTQYDKSKENIKWLYEGEILPEEWWAESTIRDAPYNFTYHDLSIPAATERHAGNYTCETPYSSETIIVHLIVDPYFETLPPRSLTTGIGEPLTIPCGVSGYPAPRVSWEKYTDHNWVTVGGEGQLEYEEMANMTVSTQETLKTHAEVLVVLRLLANEGLSQHSGLYRCRASGTEVEDIVQTTELVVTSKVVKIVNISASEVQEGGTLEIKCTVSNWEEPVAFLRGLKTLGLDPSNRFVVELLSTEEIVSTKQLNSNENHTTQNFLSTYALYVSNVSLEDRGFYECRAGPEVSKAVEAVITHLPPEVIEVVASPAVTSQDLFISCTIANMPTDHNISFYFDGQLIDSDLEPRYKVHLAELTNEVVTDSTGRAKSATYVLKVQNVSWEDSGLYRCAIDDLTEGSISIDVEEKESIGKISLEVSMDGDDLVLKCFVFEGAEEVTFFHNETFLPPPGESRISIKLEKTENATINILTIPEATSTDGGLYQCFSSPLSSAEAMVTINRKDQNETAFNNRLESPALNPGMLVQIKGPSEILEGETMNLSCVLSSAFTFYKNMIIFNETILVYDDELVSSDSRMKITVSKGVYDEILMNFVIENTLPTDSGVYECAVNTDPMTRDSHLLKVISENSTRVKANDQLDETTQESPDFWNNELPFAFTDILATPSKVDSQVTSPDTQTASTQETLLEISAKNETVIVSEGQSTFLECTAPGSKGNIIWRREGNSTSQNYLDFSLSPNGSRYEIVSPNPYTQNLLIYNTNLQDAGMYLCFREDDNSRIVQRTRLVIIDRPVDPFADDFPIFDEELISTMDPNISAETHAPQDETFITSIKNVTHSSTSTEDQEILKVPEGYDPFDYIENDISFSTTSIPLVEYAFEVDNSTISEYNDIYNESESNSIAFSNEEEAIQLDIESEKGLNSNITDETLKDEKINDMKNSINLSGHLYDSENSTSMNEDIENSIYTLHGENNLTTSEYPDAGNKDKGESQPLTTEVTPKTTATPESKGEVQSERARIPIDTETSSTFDVGKVNKETVGVFDINFEEIIPQFTEAPINESIPIIYAKPGENVVAPLRAEVILPCPTEAVPEDISWKDGERSLFLGTLDLAGVADVGLSPEGSLRLFPGVSELKQSKKYTCLVFDSSTYQDVPVMVYQVDLISDDEWSRIADSPENEQEESQIKSSFKFHFPGLNDVSIAVLTNNQRTGKSLSSILVDGGINAMESLKICNVSNNIEGWQSALSVVKQCENEAREEGSIKRKESTFAVVDFVVQIGPNQLYASYVIYVHNVALGLTSHIFGALVPIFLPQNQDKTTYSIECGIPLYTQNQPEDFLSECYTSMMSTLNNLEKTYNNIYQSKQENFLLG